MKALVLSVLVVYIAFCAALYVASRQHNVNQDPAAVAPQPVPAIQTAAPTVVPNSSHERK